MLLLASGNQALAYDFMYNGLAYNIDGDGTSVYVTYTVNNSSNYGGSLTNVVIPSQIKLDGNVTYNVTGIGQSAFSQCSNLQSVTIPASVKTIGSSAFYNCNAIKSVYVASLDAWFKTTLTGAITSSHDLYANNQKVTSLTIPSSITSIGMHLYGVTSVTSVTIPNTVTTIGSQAFAGCSNLATVNMGTGVKSIGDGAFQYCSKLTAITIPESVETLGGSAFYGCSGIKKLTWNAINLNYNGDIDAANIEQVTIGNKVQTLPSNFVRTAKITSITLPASVKTIGQRAFDRCTGLMSVAIPSGAAVGYQAFYGCSALQSLTIPATIGTVDNTAFGECPITQVTWNLTNGSGMNQFLNTGNITKVTIGSNVTSLPNNFMQNAKISSVTLPANLTAISQNAFYGCTGLTGISIPNKVTEIGNYAFYGCSSLSSLTIPEQLTTIGTNVFYNAPIRNLTWNAIRCGENGGMNTANITNVTIGNKVQVLPNYFLKGARITSITLPASLSSIWTSAFQDCSLLTSVSVPSSVTNIWSYAFSGCTSLKSLALPSGLTTINPYLCDGCTSLKSITIPSNVSQIGNNAFQNCTGLTAINIPNQVSTIGSNAFSGCTGLSSLTIPENITSIGSNAFSSCNNIKSLTWNAINLTTNGGIYTNNIEKVTIGSKVQTIPANFVANSKITAIAFPTSVKTIGTNAFDNCTSLKAISFPTGLTLIPNYICRGCTGLTSVVFPANVTTIGEYAFYGCKNLSKIVWNEKVTEIGGSAFSGCALVVIRIPASVTKIGNYAFYNNDAKKIRKYSNNISIGSKALPESGVNGNPFRLLIAPTGAYWANVSLDPNTSFEVDGVTYVITDMTNRLVKIVDIDEAKCPADIEIKKVKYRNVEFTPSEIGLCAAAGNYTLRSVATGATVTSLPYSSFYKCDALRTVDFEAVTTIDEYAFAESALGKVSLPNSVTAVSSHAFENCKQMREFIAGSDYFETENFQASPYATIYMPMSAGNYNIWAWQNGGQNLFQAWPGVKINTLNKETINGVEYYKLSFTADNPYVIFSEGNGSPQTNDIAVNDGFLYNYAGGSSCQEINIKHPGLNPGLNTIDEYMLAGCSALRYVKLGANVAQIKAHSFDGCSNIKTLRVLCATPPYAYSGVFNDLDKWTCTLYVPKGTVNTYQNANEWKTFFFISDSETEPSDGDVNGDGEVSIADVTALVTLVMSGSSNDNSDINGDGETSIADVTTLVNMVMEQ